MYKKLEYDGSCYGGAGIVIGIGYCITYFARKIWHYGGESCYGGGGIGIRYLLGRFDTLVVVVVIVVVVLVFGIVLYI